MFRPLWQMFCMIRTACAYYIGWPLIPSVDVFFQLLVLSRGAAQVNPKFLNGSGFSSHRLCIPFVSQTQALTILMYSALLVVSRHDTNS
jgi:hypothetical protein